MTHPVAGAGGELPPQDDSIRETLTKIETMICFFIAHSLYEYQYLKFHTAGNVVQIALFLNRRNMVFMKGSNGPSGT
jgi:hypothetical protein